MKLELISEYKLRAELSYEDMECLGFYSYDKVSDDALETIIGIADERLGFHCTLNACKTSVYPFGDGCEIYITRSADKRHGSESKTRKTVLSFSNMKLLTDACVFLSDQNIIGSECRAEKTKNGTVYHLIVEHECDSSFADGEPYRLFAVSELCGNDPFCKRGASLLYLNEHSNPLISKNAVETIAKMKKG
ncbi:MAG: hypothetical protein II135_05175 [Clostridia bacterium]|nr:hypothetical protein [Clostridia bacterium]